MLPSSGENGRLGSKGWATAGFTTAGQLVFCSLSRRLQRGRGGREL